MKQSEKEIHRAPTGEYKTNKRKAQSLSKFTRNQDEGELLVSNLKMLLRLFDGNFDKICAYERNLNNIPSITK